MRYGVENTGKLRNFIELVRDKPRPTQGASVKWIKGYGFTSSKDTQFLHILELLRFVDGSRKPIIAWRDFQDKSKSGEVMAKALLQGYKILYDKYPKAHTQNKDDLERVFIIEKALSDRRAMEAIRTFNVLLEYADKKVLEGGIASPSITHPIGGAQVTPQVTPQVIPQLQPQQILQTGRSEKRELAVNINLQVTLPETEDADVYDKIFAALKKHFFPDPSE